MLLYFRICWRMRQNQKSWSAVIVALPALIIPSPAFIMLLLVDRFADNIAPKKPKNSPRNPPFCSYASFLFVLLTPFINKSHSSRKLLIFMISIISSLEIINFVLPDPNKFFRKNWVLRSRVPGSWSHFYTMSLLSVITYQNICIFIKWKHIKYHAESSSI